MDLGPLRKNSKHTQKSNTFTYIHRKEGKKMKFVYIMASSVISIKGNKYSDERALFTLVDFHVRHILSHLWLFGTLPLK